jgi:hypothetical protein
MILGLAVFLTGCDDLLDVDLPGTITTDALDNPDIAEVLVNAILAAVECSYSRFIVGDAPGMADALIEHGSGANLEYQDVVDGSGCGGGDNFSWFNPFQEARYSALDTYGRIDVWTIEELARGLVEYDSREQMLAISALYASIPFQIFGEHLCEVSFDRGELFAPDTVLGMAEQWATTAIGHIQAHIAAYRIDDGSGNPGTDAAARLMPYGITDDLEAMAYALRARARWARGNNAGAAVDAAAALTLSPTFNALVTRESGGESQRQNHFWDEHVDALEVSVAGVVDWWEDPSGGTNPGGPWPVNGGGPERLIPFTGYRELAIAADGRAVDAVGNAITIATAGSVLDTRVDVVFAALGLDNGDDGWLQQKYSSEDDDITLVGWQELILIQAEGATTDAAAIVFINVLRAASSLPLVTYGPAGGQVENMILEERRRQLFLEGRFWAAKVRNQQPGTTKLWFPRELADNGEEDPNQNVLQGGVRQRMNNAEFDLNDNFSRSDRATRCITEQQPVNPLVL